MHPHLKQSDQLAPTLQALIIFRAMSHAARSSSDGTYAPLIIFHFFSVSQNTATFPL
jgi:hypothetical protein